MAPANEIPEMWVVWSWENIEANTTLCLLCSFLGAHFGSRWGRMQGCMWTADLSSTLSSTIGSSIVFWFRQFFRLVFHFPVFYCLIISIFCYPYTESYKWGVCCCSACKPASWHRCWERRLQWQAEIYHRWEACSEFIFLGERNYLSTVVNFSLFISSD